MATLAGKGGAVLVPVGTPVTLTEAPTTADAARKRYVITDASHRALTTAVNVTVETSPDGVAWDPATGYRVVRGAGLVIFDAAQPVGTQVRVSGEYQPMVDAGRFTEWSLDVEKDLADSTVLGGGGWRSFTPTLKTGSGSLSGFWVDGYWFDFIEGDAPLVLWLDADGATKRRYMGYFHATKNGVGVKVDDLDSEDVEIQSEGELAYVEG